MCKQLKICAYLCAMYLLINTYIRILPFLKIAETDIYFSDPSIQVNEDQGLVTFLLNLTNPSSSDITITVNTVDGIATGEVKIIVYTCTCISYLHDYV